MRGALGGFSSRVVRAGRVLVSTGPGRVGVRATPSGTTPADHAPRPSIARPRYPPERNGFPGFPVCGHREAPAAGGAGDGGGVSCGLVLGVAGAGDAPVFDAALQFGALIVEGVEGAAGCPACGGAA